jgi:hypothetical protein
VSITPTQWIGNRLAIYRDQRVDKEAIRTEHSEAAFAALLPALAAAFRDYAFSADLRRGTLASRN